VAGAPLLVTRELGDVLLVVGAQVFFVQRQAFGDLRGIEHEVFDVDLFGRLEQRLVVLVELLDLGIGRRHFGRKVLGGQRQHAHFAALEERIERDLGH